MVVETDVHENSNSGIDSGNDDSDDEVSDEDTQMDQAVLRASKEGVPFIPSSFAIQNWQAPMRLTIDNLDLNNLLANQQVESVLSTVKSWLTNGKAPPKDVESRQREGIVGYSYHFVHW